MRTRRVRRLRRRIERLYEYRDTFESHLPTSWINATRKIYALEAKLRTHHGG